MSACDLTLHECERMAVAIVRAMEDAGWRRTVCYQEAVKILDEIREVWERPGADAAPWVRCSVPTLRNDYMTSARKVGSPWAPAYEAIIACRLLTVEAIEATDRYGTMVHPIRDAENDCQADRRAQMAFVRPPPVDPREPKGSYQPEHRSRR